METRDEPGMPDQGPEVEQRCRSSVRSWPAVREGIGVGGAAQIEGVRDEREAAQLPVAMAKEAKEEKEM